MTLMLFAVSLNAVSQTRVKIKEGLYLVTYGNTTVIEDDINQRTISLEIIKEVNDRKNKQIKYKVVCGKWTKIVVKQGLKFAIKQAVAASGVTGGSSLIVAAASEIASRVYDDYCASISE